MHKKLKLQRTQKELTQQQLADKIGITTATYIDIEKGRKYGSINMWKKIQKEFNIPDQIMWSFIVKE